MFGRTKEPPLKPPKQYPPLTLTLEKGSVRMFRHTLRIAYPTKLITAHVKGILLEALEESIKASELACGIRCPYGVTDEQGFDKHALPFTIELCDIEQFALRHMLFYGIKSYDIVRQVPNRELLGEIFLTLDKHLIMNGGYDHSSSPDNLISLHRDSKRIKAYIKERIPRAGILNNLKNLFTS